MLRKLRYVFNRGFYQNEIDKQQLDEMVKKGATLVDVRSPQEFEEGHLDNAILLPEYEMKEKAKQILPNKSTVIIVYCSTGHRSQNAQKILQKLGYTKVYNLYGGFC